jgi:molybdate transport system substrate-binding protein
MKKIAIVLLSVLILFSVVGCTTDDTSGSSEEVVTLSVYAGGCLTEAFTEIAEAYEEENPEVTVELTFANCEVLATQIQEGAVVDVFASSDAKFMDDLIENGYIDTTETYAGNELAIIVNSESSEKIQSIEDLAADDVSLAIGDTTIAVGKHSETILTTFTEEGTYGDTFYDDVMANVVSSDLNVKDIVSKVELGEVDAGIVFLSDYVSADQDKVELVEIEDENNIFAEFPIATLTDSENPEVAQSFVDYVLSESGQSILSEYGFVNN